MDRGRSVVTPDRWVVADDALPQIPWPLLADQSAALVLGCRSNAATRGPVAPVPPPVPTTRTPST